MKIQDLSLADLFALRNYFLDLTIKDDIENKLETLVDKELFKRLTDLNNENKN